MKKSDLILIVSIIVVALISYGFLRLFIAQSSATDGKAIVIYNDSKILEIHLADGTYNIISEDNVISIDESNNLFTVTGTNGDVVIEYKDYKVRVIDEISPQHICQVQGWSNSPLRPLTCLPNNLVIVIEAAKTDNDPDDISG